MYDSSQLFSSFIKFGEQTDYDNAHQLYVYELEEGKAECRDYEHLVKALQEINSSASLKEKDGKLELEFVDSSQYWQVGFETYFYSSIDLFTRGCVKRRSVPDKFFIVDRKLSETNVDERLLKKVIHITKWTKLLADMADHIQDNNVFVFFVIHKEGKTKPYEISPFMDFDDIEGLDLDCDDKRYERLHGSWHLEDAQTKDRQSVMLVSFAEIMSSLEDGDDPFKVFLSSIKKFHDRYCENYEIYVNRFTVDSQLREIDEQHLSFVGKLQDLVTSSQTKAFALPGAMVAIGALAKTDNFLGIITIAIAVMMTKLLIFKSNELLQENLDHFKDTFDRALGHYVKSRTEAEEVKSHARIAQSKLEDQLVKAKNRVTFIDAMANWTLWIGLALAFVMLISMFKADYPKEAQVILEWGSDASTQSYNWIKAKLVNT
jgi:hypothetical protein